MTETCELCHSSTLARDYAEVEAALALITSYVTTRANAQRAA